jgi:O-glycosyl hydrolase
MFNFKKIISLSLAMFFTSSIIPTIPLFNNKVSAATANIATIDPSIQYQTVDGWGTSLAWWAKLVGEWKTDAKNEIMDLTFDPVKGLGLNMVRYNIGGAKSPADKNLRPGADVESYLLPDGKTYDWTKDGGQRWVLNEAKKRIAKDEFKAEAFSNSPPYFMTISNQSSGNVDGKSNLKPAEYQNFSDYLTTVVKHFNDEWGITFNTINPMNEPSTNYWKKGGNQEGCDFDSPEEKNNIFGQMSQSLAKKGLSTKLSGFDETGIDYSSKTIQSASNETLSAISQFNAHDYGDGSRTKLRDIAASLGKPLYMDEICTSGGAGHDANDMDNGLKIADYMFKDLRDMKTTGWDIWQVVDDEEMNKSNNSNWGLISAYWSGSNVEKYFITKQYYAMAHFSKFIRPGYKIIDANNSNIVAAIDPTSQKLVLVARNTSENDEPLMLDVSRFNTTGATIKAYRTTSAESLADVSSRGVALKDGTLKDTLPAKSMVTYVISNAKYNGEIGTTTNDNVIGTNDNQFQYSDSWQYYDSQSGAYSKDVHYSNITDSYYQVKFNGNRIKLYGTFAQDSGIAGISIDGGAETNVDLYSAVRKDNALIYVSPILDGGAAHTVKVRVTGNKNDKSSSTYVIADKVVAVKQSTNNAVTQKPQLTKVTAGYNKLYVEYNPIEGATSYNVKYGTAPGNYTKVVNNVTDASYLISGLDNGKKYYVAVSALVNGKESVNSNELAESPVSPANSNLLYYVNCGDASPNILENDEVLGTNNSTQDQPYGLDLLTGYKWGYVADEGKEWSQDTEASVGSNYGCERQYDGTTAQGGLTYKFDLPNGKYSVTMGFYDPWDHKDRLEDILINGNVVEKELCPTIKGKVPNKYVAEVKDGVLTVRVQKSITGKDKPLISWITVSK